MRGCVVTKKIFRLVHDQARRGVAEFVQYAPDGWVVTFSEPTRSLDQNAKFHAICADVRKAGAKWMGRELTDQQWKVLFVSGHAVATGIGADVIPGLEGEFVNIRESTASMSKKRGASLIEYVLAWCAENEIMLPSYGGDYDASDVQNELRRSEVRKADRSEVCSV